MDFFNKWIYTIVVAMIFTTFIEILMPNNAMKKYTKIILGLLIMTVILNPVLNFINKDFSLSGYSFKFQNKLDSIYMQKQSIDYSEKQSEAVTKLYRFNLQNQIEQQMKKEINGNDVKVNVEVNENIKSDKYGEVTKITLIVSGKLKSVDKIEKVSIPNKKTDEIKKTSNSYEVLKNKIAAMYNIEKDKIEVKVNE